MNLERFMFISCSVHVFFGKAEFLQALGELRSIEAEFGWNVLRRFSLIFYDFWCRRISNFNQRSSIQWSFSRHKAITDFLCKIYGANREHFMYFHFISSYNSIVFTQFPMNARADLVAGIVKYLWLSLGEGRLHVNGQHLEIVEIPCCCF